MLSKEPPETPLAHLQHHGRRSPTVLPWMPWRIRSSLRPRSSLKHGLDEVAILHAYRNPIRAWDLGDGFTMIIGANEAALILEVGYIRATTTVVIVHAMQARKKFLR